MSRRTLHVAQILWPAFFMAGVLEMVVFSVLDPSLIHIGAWEPDAPFTAWLSWCSGGCCRSQGRSAT